MNTATSTQTATAAYAASPESFSHPIKCAEAVYLYFRQDFTGPAVETTQIHRIGCAHTAKAESVGRPVTGPLGADDWVYVAPCARKA